MVNIDVKEIVKTLFNSIGIKENVSDSQLWTLFNRGKLEYCVEKIADYLGLPIKVSIAYSSSFETKQMVETDEVGKGKGGITAQVFMPTDLPFYGTKALVNFPISVKLTGNIKEHPDTFMAIMAHELSHVLLRVLRHKEKENEFYTDITAMMLGFNEIMKRGREAIEIHQSVDSFYTTTTTRTTTYGYLDKDQFWIAHDAITKLLQRNKKITQKLMDQYESSKKQLEKIKGGITKFKKYLNFLDTHLKQKIKAEDIEKVIEFHQSGYIEEKESFIKPIEKRLYQQKKCESISHYYPSWEVSFDEALTEIESIVKSQKRLLKSDLMVLNRNIGFWNKIVINLFD
jgi:hypothetical protein